MLEGKLVGVSIANKSRLSEGWINFLVMSEISVPLHADDLITAVRRLELHEPTRPSTATPLERRGSAFGNASG